MTRNERKRAAKAKRLAMEAARIALTKEQAIAAMEKADRMAELASEAKAFGRMPFYQSDVRQRNGVVIKGKFVARPMAEPAKRNLTECPITGKMIEKRVRYVK